VNVGATLKAGCLRSRIFVCASIALALLAGTRHKFCSQKPRPKIEIAVSHWLL
jgi:hypothetical protein